MGLEGLNKSLNTCSIALVWGLHSRLPLLNLYKDAWIKRTSQEILRQSQLYQFHSTGTHRSATYLILSL